MTEESDHAFGAEERLVHGSRFVGRQWTTEGTFFVPFPIEDVFPLYGPVEEARWAPGWEPNWVYPDKAVVEASKTAPGWVFTTGRGPTDTRVWYVLNVNLARHEISYLVHWPGQMIYRIDVSAESVVDPRSRMRGTSTTVRYEIVGLSEAGNDEIARRSGLAGYHAERMEHWRRSIQEYLEARGH
jgi:hypothetical protein